MKNIKLFYLVNVDWFFVSHRLPIALDAIKKGYNISIVTKNTGMFTLFREKGFSTFNMNLTRSGINPLKEILVIFKIFYIYLFQKPDIVHHVALKSVLYGSIASKFLRIPTVNSLSGLGYLFTEKQRNVKFRNIIKFILRNVINSEHSILIMQNNDDAEYFVNNNIIKRENLRIIRGSGVDLEVFKFSEEPNSAFIKVVFPARLLIDKGIIEFIEASRIIKTKYENVEFQLIGDLDIHNPTAINKLLLDKAILENHVCWPGFQEDMVSVYTNSHIVVLPSYREGLPKALIEACSIGRPIVTTNVPGCRDVVKNNVNGFLVPPKDSKSLAEAIEKLIIDGELRIKMGKFSREIAEKYFSIESVINKTLKIYEEILIR